MEQQEPTFERLGRYELVRKIATGGMAELFLARSSGPGGFEKRCAVKRILPQHAGDAEFLRMFLNEARVAAMFDHPNIVQIFDHGTDENTGQHFIAMELVNGLDLRQLLRLAREQGLDVPPELAAYMMAQALDGLAYAHEFRDPAGVPLNVVHRDVSPQNILVSYDGSLKLVDFGIVKVNAQEGHTQTGLLKGKVAYMSPEQAAGEPIDGRADVFAIGVCLYELITGVKPFRGTTEIMTLKAILDQEPQPLTHFVPECPVGIEAAIDRALRKAPSQRFASARDFQIELLSVLRSCPVPLDRHVLAQFVRSVTEGGTARFDTAQLKIPRHVTAQTPGPRFAGGPTAEADEAWRAEAAMAFRTALDAGRTRVPPSVFQPVAPRSGDVAPMAGPIPAANTDSGVFARAALDAQAEADVARAAGLGRSRAPTLLAVALAGAVLASGAAWLWSTSEPGELEPVPASPSGAAAVAAPSAAPTPPTSPAPSASALAPAPSPSERPRVAAEPTERPRPSEPARSVDATERAKDPERADRRRARDGKSEGRLTLATKPRGLTVTLGGKVIGTTPLEAVELPVGKHTLALASSRFGIQRSLTVEVAAGELTTKTVDVPRGKLVINARPFAEVYVDGEHVGTTPVTRPVYEGRHEVKLVSEAGEQIRLVDVGADQDVPVNVKF
jgi:serine/threonine-protein kinase